MIFFKEKSVFDIKNDEFELRGEWWLEEKPKQKLFGVLKYSKDTGSTTASCNRCQEIFKKKSKHQINLSSKRVPLSECSGRVLASGKAGAVRI